ncbi:BglG family transcription antiterminator [Paenibacillus marinisediminis]
MYLSSRQRMLLSMLLQGDSYVTTEQLALELDTSTRTVHREVKEIEDMLTPYGLVLVKKTGAGIRLEGTQEAKLELQELLMQGAKTLDYTPNERKIILLCRLLQEEEPVKLLLLADEAHVTVATAASDLDSVEQWVDPFRLTLIRRRGYGIELVGAEFLKQRAIISLITESVSESERIGLIRGEHLKGGYTPGIVTEKLMSLIAIQELPRIDTLIRQLPVFTQNLLADISYADLILRLSILVKRRSKYRALVLPSQELLHAISPLEHEAAEQIANAMQSIVGEPLLPVEKAGIALYVRGAQPGRVQPEMELAALERAELHATMLKLVYTCEQKLGIPFSEDKVLLEGLMAHLEPAVHRLRERHPVTNQHLKRIMEDYGELFEVISEAMRRIMPNVTIPNDEIGFLVLHFAAAVERTYRLRRRIRTVVFCSSGIGTSKMLASRLQREIPEIEIVGNVSVFEVHQLDKSKYDIIISTIMLPIDPEKYILVSPLLTTEELSRIRKRIKLLTDRSWQDLRPADEPDVRPIKPLSQELNGEQDVLNDEVEQHNNFAYEREASASSLDKLKTYVDLSLAITMQFRQHDLPSADTLEEVLLAACREMEQEGVVRHAENIAEKLIERQRVGGLGIPTTELALMHTRSVYVQEPVFRLFRLAKPLQLEAMDYSMMKIQDVLLMLSPQHAAPEVLEILSEISSFFIDSQTIECFATHDEMQMRSHLQERLYAFCYEKVTRKGKE